MFFKTPLLISMSIATAIIVAGCDSDGELPNAIVISALDSEDTPETRADMTFSSPA